MSYGRFGAPVAQQEYQSESVSLSCKANGCRNRGTVDAGGGFMCFVHAHDADWRMANDALHKHPYLMDAINEVVSIGDMEWWGGKWKSLHNRFSHLCEMQPTEAERNHRRWYEYRLRQQLAYYAGSIAKPPVPREALKPIKPRMTTMPSAGDFV